MTYFLDTFALVELLNGNRAYREFSQDAKTSLYNLYELHVQIGRARSDEVGDTLFRDLRHLVLDVEDEDVLFASRFKREHARQKFSYADALGYAMARRRQMAFVTGDQAFRDVDGVRFVATRTTARRP